MHMGSFDKISYALEDKGLLTLENGKQCLNRDIQSFDALVLFDKANVFPIMI